MITKMEVFSANPSAPELPLAGFMPSSDPIHIRNIDGLEPVKAEITSTQLASGRGETPQGSSVGKRNIVLTLGFNPDWPGGQTISSLRQMLYRYFMPTQWCKLRFFSDYLPVVDIEGECESVSPNIFSSDPEFQVSLLCHKPDFIEVESTIYTGTVDDGSIELEFEYLGTVDAGFELRIDRSATNIAYTGPLDVTLKSPVVPQVFSIDPVTIDSSKYFKLSTVPGFKRAQNVATLDAALTNLLSSVDDFAVWPQLKPGMNVLSVAALEDGQQWTFAFFNRFGGL